MSRWSKRLFVLCALAAVCAASTTATSAGGAGDEKVAAAAAAPGQGLRFASLKSDRVNLRAGPGTEYPASWVFRRAGLPVEILKEFEAWRQVRDAEGVSGWVLKSFLSVRRTALVLPWEVKPDAAPPQTPLHVSDSESSRASAIVEAGVIANVVTCDGTWCEVTVEDVRGYIEQKKLWGVYPGEIVR